MADNNDYIPIYTEVERPNQLLNKNFYTEGNRVESSAIGCIVTGDGNYVSHACANVSILNSSGCIVYQGVTGATILNSSGIIVSDSDVVYINNQILTASSIQLTGAKGVYSDYTAEVQYDTIVALNPGITINIPKYADIGYAKRWNIKNLAAGQITIATNASYLFDGGDQTTLTIDYPDNVSLESTIIDGAQDTVLIV